MSDFARISKQRSCPDCGEYRAPIWDDKEKNCQKCGYGEKKEETEKGASSGDSQ